MVEIQRNAVIDVPKVGRSLEVQLPAVVEGASLVYSISSNADHKVYLDPFKLLGVVGSGRFMVYSSDALFSNDSWMLDQHGRRIC